MLAASLALALAVFAGCSPGQVGAQAVPGSPSGSSPSGAAGGTGEPRYAPDQVIVGLEAGEGEQTLEAPKDATGAEEDIEIANGRVEVLALPAGRDTTGAELAEAVETFEDAPGVAYAERDAILVPDAVASPDDARYGEQWALANTGQTGGTADADVDAPEAWTLTRGAGASVAVIDSGVDTSHPDLKDNLWTNPGEVPANGLDDDRNGKVDDVHGWDFRNGDASVFDSDETDHGTHVAGIVAARSGNGAGVAGVAPEARVASLKFSVPTGSGFLSHAAAALDYAAAEGIPVSNNSYGCAGSPCDSLTLKNAISRAGAAGHLYVASAGNGGSDAVGDDNDATPQYPASYDLPNILSVAATGDRDELAAFSNYGANSVDLGAPGRFVLSTLPGGGYGTKSGTSMAAPHVAGAAALVKSLSLGADAATIKAKLMDSADKVASLSGKTASGGRLNAASAVGYVAPVEPVDACPDIAGVQASPEECAPAVETGAETSLALSPSARSLSYGQRLVLRGTLRTQGGGVPVAGSTVHLERSTPSGGYERFATATTAADGSYEHSFAPEESDRYRAVFEGDGAAAEPSTSAEESVGVRALVTNATSTRKVKVGRSKTLSGTVAPAHGGESVRITVSGGGRTRTLSDNLDASSRFAAKFRPTRKGVYTVRVSFAGDADHLAATSNAKKFRAIPKKRR